MVHLKYNNIALGNYFGEPFAFGKDEVPGPNPGISSTIKARKCVVCGLCYFLPAILIFKKPLQKPQRGINFSRAGDSHSAFFVVY